MPQTVFDAGDPITSRLRLGVNPDGTTAVDITVYRPDGTAIADPAVSAWSAANEKTAQFYATDDGQPGSTTVLSAGDWLAVWTVTGTGAGIEAKVYPVRPLPSPSNLRPSWSPFLSDVADFVPRLTIDQGSLGEPVELGTFTGSTEPTDEQVQRLIDRAVVSVSTVLGTVAPSLYEQAQGVAAMRAAAAAQRGYARDSDAMRLATELDASADAELGRLVTANSASGSSSSVALLPVWSFPDPPDYGDLTFY